jgi:hypothetical protein
MTKKISPLMALAAMLLLSAATQQAPAQPEKK